LSALNNKTSEFNDAISKIISTYDDYLKGIKSLDELYIDYMLPFLKSSSEYQGFLGENVKTLDLFLMNFKDKFDAYKEKNAVGIEVEARAEKQKAMVIAKEIIDELISIQNQLIANNSIADEAKIEKENTVLKEDEDLTLNENDWDKLVSSIKKGECLPFIGAEPFSPWIALEIKNYKDWTKFYSLKVS